MNTVSLEEAANLLQHDKVVAITTETVYGLAANAFSETAVNRVFETKGRPSYNPLIVHIASLEQLDTLITELPEEAKIFAQAFWPGPLTLLLPKSDKVSDRITAGKPTVAIRMPKHPVALALLNRLDFPLVAPSANRFKHISQTRAEHVSNSLGDQVAILDGGACSVGLESTIVGFDTNGTPVVFRQGSIELERLRQIDSETYILEQTEDTLSFQAPGMDKRHYAPRTPLLVVTSISSHLGSSNPELRFGIIEHKKGTIQAKAHEVRHLSDHGDLGQMAEKLYSVLHELDTLELDYLLIEPFDSTGLGRTLNDKIRRASAVN